MEGTFLIPKDALAAARLAPGMTVADFGAGSGFFTRAAARVVGPDGVVWAVDANPDLLVRIKNLALAEGLRNVEIIRGDAAREGGSNLPADHFDFVIVANILFVLDDKVALAREAARVLRPGGEALVIDWRDSFGGLGPHPDHVVTIGAGRDYIEKGGLKYVEDLPETATGAYHWGFVARKPAPGLR